MSREQEINEEAMELMAKKQENMSAYFYDKYSEQMDVLEGSPLSRVRSINQYDVYALGKQLESLEVMFKMHEAEGTTSSLGQLPKIGFDVVSVAYGSSIIPLISSVQPIEEESGIVWYKDVRASITKGNMTAEDRILQVEQPMKTPQNYSTAVVGKETLGTSTGAQTDFSGTLATFPIKRESFVIYKQTAGAGAYVEVGRDDGNGVVLGNLSFWGTINYDTGAFAINFAAAANGLQNTDVLAADYQEDYEAATDLPRVHSFWNSKNIRAKVYALKGVNGMLRSFAMSKRFGAAGIAEDEMANDLINAINAEIGGELILALVANAQGNTNYASATPAEISFYEHRQGFMKAMAEAEVEIATNAGRGVISCMVAGLNACGVLQAVNGFEKITDGVSHGPHLYGTLNGIPIIRVPEVGLLGTNTIIPFWKGGHPFEAPIAYSPFMPITTTAALPNGTNPLITQQAAAVWAGIDILVPNFITQITIT